MRIFVCTNLHAQKLWQSKQKQPSTTLSAKDAAILEAVRQLLSFDKIEELQSSLNTMFMSAMFSEMSNEIRERADSVLFVQSLNKFLLSLEKAYKA